MEPENHVGLSRNIVFRKILPVIWSAGRLHGRFCAALEVQEGEDSGRCTEMEPIPFLHAPSSKPLGKHLQETMVFAPQNCVSAANVLLKPILGGNQFRACIHGACMPSSSSCPLINQVHGALQPQRYTSQCLCAVVAFSGHVVY